MKRALATLLFASALAGCTQGGTGTPGTVEEALQIAARQNKLVTLKFYADW